MKSEFDRAVFITCNDTGCVIIIITITIIIIINIMYWSFLYFSFIIYYNSIQKRLRYLLLSMGLEARRQKSERKRSKLELIIEIGVCSLILPFHSSVRFHSMAQSYTQEGQNRIGQKRTRIPNLTGPWHTPGS